MKVFSFSRILGIGVLFFTIASSAEGAEVIYAASCSQVDVQRAVDLANEGSIVSVPVGTCNWNTTVVVDMKSITLQGAGSDKTVIIDNTPTGYAKEVINVNGIEGKFWRITGFKFVGSTGTGSEGIIRVGGTTKQFRIDNNKFDLNGRGIWIEGYTYGVIDNNYFTGATTQNCMIVREGAGDTPWTRPLGLGTKNAVYIENNEFIFSTGVAGNGAVDCSGGGRVVIRNNKFQYIVVGVHGADSTSGFRSCFSYEIYDNIFTSPSVIFTAIGNLRGGTGVIFNNSFDSNFTDPILVTNYRTCYGYGAYAPGWPQRCDGSSQWDGNTPNERGYPCLDQIGRSTNQTLEPLYEWNNFKSGIDVNINLTNFSNCTSPSVADHIRENRDYYNNTPRPDYQPYAYPHPLRLIPNPPLQLHIANP